MLELGTAIRITRQAKGMRLASLAKASGLSSPFLSLLENGKKGASLGVVRRIASALDVPVEALILLAEPLSGSLRSSDKRANELARLIRGMADAEIELGRRLAREG
jgi:transcriptional regulator with XRE-family HTH domain